jgi:hypothetical protein
MVSGSLRIPHLLPPLKLSNQWYSSDTKIKLSNFYNKIYAKIPIGPLVPAHSYQKCMKYIPWFVSLSCLSSNLQKTSNIDQMTYWKIYAQLFTATYRLRGLLQTNIIDYCNEILWIITIDMFSFIRTAIPT